jgi:uncharacterized protein
MGGREALLRHLDSDYTEPVRDPVWKHIYLHPALAALVESGPLLKLAGIRQLGPAYLLYPGATHTRYGHSLGVFQLARRMAGALLKAPEGGEELSSMVSVEGLKSFLAAALLHDLGHFPFAHSLKELPLKAHEALTAELIQTQPVRTALGEYGADPYMTAAIVDEDLPSRNDGQIAFFRRVLSGVLDPDKLDYLNRDAYFCGIPYGVQDIDFVISRIRPVLGKSDGDGGRTWGVAIDSKGIPAVENVLFSKYLMYRAVYWHRTVRAATSMIKKAVVGALAEGVVRPEDLYGKDDDGFVRLAAASSYGPFGLVARVMERRLFAPILEVAFDPADPVHTSLVSIGSRSAAEVSAARRLSQAAGTRLSPEEVIVDIPEPVSFESDMFVSDEGRPFNESSTVFKRPVIDGFTGSLRTIRVFTARPLDRASVPPLAELV